MSRRPHWLKLNGGCYLGFRKPTAASTGTWLARFRDDNRKQHKRSFVEYAEMTPSQRRGGAAAGLRRSGGQHATDRVQVIYAIDFNNLLGVINEPRTFGVAFKASL